MRVLIAGLIATLVLGVGSPPTSAGEPGPRPEAAVTGSEGVRIRKDVQDLSPQEREQFVSAVKALKERCSPYPAGVEYSPLPDGYRGCRRSDGTINQVGLSWYDQLVLWHLELSRCNPTQLYNMNGHNGPLFLPWHRAYLLLFEDALREVSGKNITVPYWDTTDARSTAATFTDELMGGNGDKELGWRLTSGPFSADEWNNFPIRNQGAFWGASATSHITRNMGSLGGPKEAYKPPNAASEVEAAMKPSSYDVHPYDDSSDDSKSFRNALEGWEGNGGTNPADQGPSRAYCSPDAWSVVPMRRNMAHNKAHTYIGGIIGRTADGASVLGTMAAVPTSPNDPVFFLLHSNVDRIWALWQENVATRDGASPNFPTDSPNPWDDPNRPMHPFVADGISFTPAEMESVDELGYRYAHPRSMPAIPPQQPRQRAADAGYFCRIGPGLRGFNIR